MNNIKEESGERRQFSTGAQKQPATGKGTPVLFPPDAYLEICKHFEDGGIVHGDRNWEKGIPLSELMNSLERHIAQEKMGLIDERHDRALAWNAVVYLATKMRILDGVLPPELADIPALPVTQVEITDKGKRDEFGVFESIGGHYWFIFNPEIDKYLKKDLTITVKNAKSLQFPTKAAAEECLERYLRR